MISNRSAPSAPVVPVLVYEDVAKMIDWLRGAFGFVERLRAPGRDGVVSHAQLRAAGADLIIGRAGGPYKAPQPDGTSQYVLITVEDVDAHFAQAKAFGAHIISPPEDLPFGARHYTVCDPGGHWWTFQQNIADVAPHEWGAVVAAPRN
jgi:uncharacterized glyoxalase superfamily protein PhnB